MKPLSTSTFTFSKLIEGNFLYVDKTAEIYRLLEPAFGQYFLSRPRRFGKSLLISTLKAIFLGQRDLFAGLAISDTDYDWKRYPVVHLDLGDRPARTVDELSHSLIYLLDRHAEEAGVALTQPHCAARFHELIDKLSQRGRVVVLIDEYDKPLLGHLGKDSAIDIQQFLKSFYAVIKTTEAQQRFALLTGVSKFSKVSVFSDLNNLTDLTMRRDSATLLGYTQTELEANFGAYVDRLAEQEGRDRTKILDQLRKWYNGYRFEENAETVYNPVSVMKCFAEKKFKNFWFETGTPSFLLDLIKKHPIDLNDLTVPETAFSTYEPTDLEPLPLLVQTGYLTIQGLDDMGGMRQFSLGYPNREIEQSFSYWLARSFGEVGDSDVSRALRLISAALREARIDDALEHLKTFFAGIPNTITLKNEKYYQTIFFVVFKLIGAIVEAETSTNVGRVDAIVKTDTHVFIFEFKLHGTAEEALAQIRSSGYAAPYRDDPRIVTVVGVAFSPETRNLHRWIAESA